MYLPTTSESSDSSSESSVVPSCKRCRSPAATMTSPIHATRAVEEDIDMDVLANIEADTMAVEVAVDRNVVARVDAGIDMEVNVGVDVEDEVESSDRGTIEVGVDVAAGVRPRQGGNARRKQEWIS
ncbi:hypothetical protein Tco_0130611 [Tanacetum coccineum]